MKQSSKTKYRMLRNHQTGTAYDWALEFDAKIKHLILSGDHKAIIDYSKLASLVARPTATSCCAA